MATQRNRLAEPGLVLPLVRSCGERTTDACRALLAGATGGSDPEVIERTPFEEALRETFRRGNASRAAWLLCLDGDVLPSVSGLAACLERALAAPPETFCVTAKVLDRGWGGERAAGVHLYRADVLDEALEHLPPPGAQVRPENHVLTQMDRRGRLHLRLPVVAGLHGFEQYYRDLLRVGVQYAVKHAEVMKALQDPWMRLAAEEPDYRVLCAGYRLGGLVALRRPFDAAQYPDDAGPILALLGLAEKAPLAADDVTAEEVERRIQAWPESEAYRALHAYHGQKRLRHALRAAYGRLVGLLRRRLPPGLYRWVKRGKDRLFGTADAGGS
jgi:hypothetical protein